MEQSADARLRKLRIRRAVLRALNGAGLGILLGAVTGALLGAGFARLVLGEGTGPPGFTSLSWFGAFCGALPGAFAGFWIGMTMILRDSRRGIVAGTGVGVLVSVFYTLLLSGVTDGGAGNAIGWSILASGWIGGWFLSFLIRKIRARWGWWTRWEE